MTTLRRIEPPPGYTWVRKIKGDARKIVAVARKSGDGDLVVVKMYDAAEDDPLLERFRASVHVRVENVHRGISPVLEYGRARGGAFFTVSPYVPTTRPARWVAADRGRRFPLFARRLAEPLAFLHARGIFHGDLKPDNLLFRAEGDRIAELRLTDFLPPLYRRRDRFGTVSGTFGYLAPEVIRGEEPDVRSELYSFGVTLYEVLRGRAAFAGTPEEIARRQLLRPPRTEVPAAWGLAPHAVEALEALVQVDPRDRPASVEEFVARFTGEPMTRHAPLVPAHPPFVGREEVIRRILRWETAGGRPVFLLRGAPGIGKTRVVQRIVGDRRWTGRPPVSVALPPGTAEQPYEGTRLLFQALAGEPMTLDVARLAGRAVPSPGSSDAAGGEVAIFRRLRRLWDEQIAAIADGDRPLLVVVDDFDRIDAVSARFLRFLVDREEPGPARFVLSVAEPCEGDAQATVERLRRRHLARTTVLSPFGEETVAECLTAVLGPGTIPPELIREAVSRSGGVPGVLFPRVGGWVRGGVLRRSADGFSFDASRAGARDPVESPFAPGDLGDEVRRLGEAVAVVGVAREGRVFRKLARLPEERWAGAVRDLADAGVVEHEPGPRGGRIAVVDEARATALLRAAPRAVVRRLHRDAARLAEEDERRGEPGAALRLARHLEGSGMAVAARRKYLQAAAELDRLSLPGAAADAYRKALRFRVQPLSAERRGEILLRIAELRLRTKDPRAGLAAIRTLLAGAPKGKSAAALRARAHGLGAWMRHKLGDTAGAEREMAAALRQGRSLPPAVAASILNDRAWLVLERGKPDEALALLEQGLALLEGQREPVLRGRLLNRIGGVAFTKGDWARASDAFRRSLGVLERAKSSEAVKPLSNLGLVRFFAGRLSDARDHLERALALARETENVREEAQICEDLGRVLFRLGAWKEAERRYDEASTAYREYDAEEIGPGVPLSRGLMFRERGLLDRSLREVRRGLEMTRERSVYERFDALNLLALTHIAREEPGPAAEAIREAGRVFHGPKLRDHKSEGLYRRTRGRLAILTRREEDADRELAEALRLFRAGGERQLEAETALLLARHRLSGPGRPAPGPALRRAARWIDAGEDPLLRCRLDLVRGIRSGEAGRADEAIRHFRSSVETARRLGARVDLAEGLARLGAAYEQSGEKRRARRALDDAAALYQDLRRVTPPPFLAKLLRSLAGKGEDSGEGLRVISRISEAIHSLHDVEEILEKALDLAVDHLGAERGLILLYDETGRLATRKARSLEGEDLEDLTRFSGTLFRRAEEGGDPLVSANAREDARFRGADSVEKYHILSVLAAPLCARGAREGLLYLDHRKEASVFSAGDGLFLRTIADLTSIAIENARLLAAVRGENRRLREAAARQASTRKLVVRSGAMRKVVRRLEDVADADITVLLLGETGVGKELAADLLHQKSRRVEGPFVKVNIASLPPTLVESELFGHEKGAFTLATERRIGRLEAATGGTLLLDEIGDLPVELQVKLLRALQEGEIQRLGSAETIRVDVRIVAATNRDLEAMVESGAFRPDLFYRLNACTITLPPLRERPEDVPELAAVFLHEFSRRNGKSFRGLSRAAADLLGRYDWPGNVRELEHVIERAVVLYDGPTLQSVHLPESIRRTAPAVKRRRSHAPTSLPERIRGIEADEIRRALEEADGNLSEAARRLGIHEATMRKKVRLYRIRRRR